MILQEEFKKSGYKDILVGDTASEYEIDLKDIFELNHKPEELLSIFISEQRDELFFLLDGDLEEIDSLCDCWDDRIRVFTIINGKSKALHKLKYNIVQLIVYSGDTPDKSREGNLLISRKIIIKGDMADKEQIVIDDDEVIISVPNITQGHNFALLANFGRIFGTTDVTATVFGMFNVGKDDAYVNQSAIDSINTAIGGNGNSIGDINQYTKITSIIFSALLSYSPTESIKFSMGPYITMTKFTEPPVVSLKLQASLGGGKF